MLVNEDEVGKSRFAVLVKIYQLMGRHLAEVGQLHRLPEACFYEFFHRLFRVVRHHLCALG